MATEGSEGRDESAGQPPIGARVRRGSGVGLWLLAAALLVAVAAGAWYAEEIRGFVRLHAWDRSGPVASVVAYAEAIDGGDQAKLERLAPGIALDMVDGKVSKMKPPSASPQMPPQDPAKYTPALPLTDPAVSFSYVKSMASVTSRSRTGDMVTAELERAKDGWRVRALYVSK